MVIRPWTACLRRVRSVSSCRITMSGVSAVRTRHSEVLGVFSHESAWTMVASRGDRLPPSRTQIVRSDNGQSRQSQWSMQLLLQILTVLRPTSPTKGLQHQTKAPKHAAKVNAVPHTPFSRTRLPRSHTRPPVKKLDGNILIRHYGIPDTAPTSRVPTFTTLH